MPKWRPLADRVLVKRDEAPNMSKGGVALPSKFTDKPLTGIVLSVGPGKQLDNGGRSPMEVKMGDRVMFGRFAGTEPGPEFKDVILLGASEIIAVQDKE